MILVSDPSTSSYDDGRVLLGGSPRRALRLTDRGAARARALLAGAAVADDVDAALARRLLDAGLAHPVSPAAPSLDHVAVVVPAYGTRHLADCLASLPPNAVVVDDGSPDAIEVASVRLPVNCGPAAARNAGLAATSAPIVAFVDSDVSVSADTLGRLAAMLDDPAVGAVAPRIYPAASRLDLGPRPGAVRPGGRPSYVPSTVLVVRRTAIESVGGFDERLRVGEDVDLVWRLVDAGWTVRYAPELTAVHHEPASSWARLDRSRRYGTSAGPLARRHPGAPLSPPLAPVAAVLLALSGRPRLAAALLIGVAVRPGRRMHAAGVPARDAATVAGTSTLAATAYAARWLVQIWSPALVVLARKQGRAARLALLALSVTFRVSEGGPTDTKRHSQRLLDELAYGVGVWAGCVRARSFRPVWPIRPIRRRAATPGMASFRQPSS